MTEEATFNEEQFDEEGFSKDLIKSINTVIEKHKPSVFIIIAALLAITSETVASNYVKLDKKKEDDHKAITEYCKDFCEKLTASTLKKMDRLRNND